MESHQQHVREVLCHLWLHGLFAKPEKCEFHSDSVEYLGYCLSPEGLTMACQVRVYSSRGSGQVRMETDEGEGQRAGQGISLAGVETDWIQRQGG